VVVELHPTALFKAVIVTAKTTGRKEARKMESKMESQVQELIKLLSEYLARGGGKFVLPPPETRQWAEELIDELRTRIISATIKDLDLLDP
jgi:hypothetical protein